jgi:hypothetical protein
MSAHYNCPRGSGGRFTNWNALIIERLQTETTERIYENKTAELSVLIAMTSTVFTANGAWHEIVEPRTTWEAAYNELGKMAADQGILTKCPNTICLDGSIWNQSTRMWDACPDCNGVGYVPVKVATAVIAG